MAQQDQSIIVELNRVPMPARSIVRIYPDNLSPIDPRNPMIYILDDGQYKSMQLYQLQQQQKHLAINRDIIRIQLEISQQGQNRVTIIDDLIQKCIIKVRFLSRTQQMSYRRAFLQTLLTISELDTYETTIEQMLRQISGLSPSIARQTLRQFIDNEGILSVD